MTKDTILTVIRRLPILLIRPLSYSYMRSCVITLHFQAITFDFLKKSAMFLEIHLFLPLAFILASIPLSSSQYINDSVLGADGSVVGGSNYCISVPYPFGYYSTALPGFKIGCPQAQGGVGSPPFLTISNKTYGIQEISLQGYVKIFSGPIQKRCIGANGKWMEPEVSGEFNLEGTPFTLSYQYNMLTVVGCNNLVSITNRQDRNLTSGCVTFCDPHGNLLRGSCSGLGCCQATLPGALKSFELEFKQVSELNSSGDLFNCSTAFFSQRDDFQSNTSRFLFQNKDDYDTNSHSDKLIQLDWAIGNKSCGVARNDIDSFACKNNSYCYDPPSMVGYLCNCSQGYKGNPYVEDGCTGIILFFFKLRNLPLFETCIH
jgi:hypothetical protein